jgi:branched-chain amino acid transport system ATP-binding protein
MNRAASVDSEPPGGPNAIVVSDLSLAFGGLQALNHVSLEVPRGHVVGVIGPNGAGKTSLLNCMSGYYRAQNGSIQMAGRDVRHLRPAAIARLGVARTFQAVQLIPDASVIENVLVGRHTRMRVNLLLAMLYVGPAMAAERRERARVEALLAELGIADLRDHEVSTLPYGQLRRVEIARALAAEANVLLLDEPTSGMNHSERAKIGSIIHAMRDQGLTQLIVEHDVRFISTVCDSVVVLNFGTVIAQGKPADVLSDEKVTEAYLGRQAGQASAGARRRSAPAASPGPAVPAQGTARSPDPN